MADGEPEVKDVERVEIEPAKDGSETVPPAGDTAPNSSPAPEGTTEKPADPEKDPADASPDGKPEALVKTPKPAAADAPPAAPVAPEADQVNDLGLVRLPEETDREWALRNEVTRLRRTGREERAKELTPPAPSATKRELTDDDKKVLGKYKPQELAALREVIPVLAKEMGFVKDEEMQGATYAEKAQGELDSFLDKHPEYLPENDKDGVLWNALKSEFAIFKPPQNPREYRKLLERAHQSAFGIKGSGSLPKNQAAERKIQVASHGSAPGPGPSSGTTTRQTAPTGIRLDMLKGFSEAEIKELGG